MRSRISFVVVVLTMGWAASAGAQPMMHEPMRAGPAFMENVFPPRLIMRYQTEIGLTAEQRRAITGAMGKAQEKILDLQWQSEAESQKLAKILGATTVDEEAALAQAERVIGLEQRIKREHLSLLIRVKNQLEPTQQEKLRNLRSEHRKPPFAGRRP